MAEDRNDRILSLANALITARGKGDVPSAITALSDAEHILYGNASDPTHKAWQRQHGLIPTTHEEDVQKSEGWKRGGNR